jgi:lipopolysaccharide transport system permease protein
MTVLQAASPDQRSAYMVYVWDLFRELIARDMKLRYKRSVIGIAWTLLNPLAELGILFLIFGLVLPLNIPNYPAFLFTGILAYGWFQNSLHFATGAIVGNRELVRQPGFPVLILPVVTVATNLIHFLLALPILVALLIYSGIQLTWAVAALPLVIVLQFLFTLSLAYLVATFHVRFRDTQYLLRVLLQLGFYLTPVFYAPSAIPERYQLLYRLNPLVFLVDGYRAVLIRGEFPALGYTTAVTIVAAVLLLAGLHVFRRASHRFVDEL